MNCFHHPQTAAVGICKNCCRGLCNECAVDVGNGLACKGVCETEVKALVEIDERSKSVYKKASSLHKRNALLYALLSAAFLIFGVSDAVVSQRNTLLYLLMPLVLVCAVAASFSLKTGIQLGQKKQ